MKLLWLPFTSVEVSNNKITSFLDCGSEQEIRPRDNIVCKECNGRIFYKKRLNKASQYEAR